ncbi:hypothetical protein [Acetobacterium woodii]|uniref:hypothetical protein n=1 Tax=Acetobacterium woodii TaxID=33952 RepID=UPI0003123157|nr:hypothetical protein [Acetobacterium woodii]
MKIKLDLKILLPALPYLLLTAMIFFILPTLDPNSTMFTLFLLVIIPVYCFICAYLYGIKNGFIWVYPIIIAVVFLPSIFLIIGYKAVIYAIIYGSSAMIGIVIGKIVKNRRDGEE